MKPSIILSLNLFIFVPQVQNHSAEEKMRISAMFRALNHCFSFDKCINDKRLFWCTHSMRRISGSKSTLDMHKTNHSSILMQFFSREIVSNCNLINSITHIIQLNILNIHLYYILHTHTHGVNHLTPSTFFVNIYIYHNHCNAKRKQCVRKDHF